MPEVVYFSGLKTSGGFARVKDLEVAPFGKRHSLGDSIAFRHDILLGMPAEYQTCDVLYTELAWSRGLLRFNQFSKAHTDFSSYMLAVANHIRWVNVPSYIVAGSEARRYLGPVRAEVRLNGARAYLFTACDAPIDASITDTEDLIRWLAGRYSRVGDFCCGLGRTGRIFRSLGKQFVMSDINGQCITHVAKEFHGQ